MAPVCALCGLCVFVFCVFRRGTTKSVMKTDIKRTAEGVKRPRPPVVAMMGHIDHGKSTLLDYIRKTNLAEHEAGGITQHLGAYEVAVPEKRAEGEGPSAKKEWRESGRTITFLDTPGHEAFRGIRARGATVADIAVLVVSGEEGAKPQTLEALRFIQETKTPFLVALTKIDRPSADIERTKQSLAEHQIFVEGYGGDVPCVPLSSKTGEGVGELLEMILLIAELHDVRADTEAPPRGFILEADIDKTKGIAATLLVKEGTVRKGAFIVAEDAYAPTRCFEDMAGTPIKEAGGGRPVRVFCWNKVPRAGAEFHIAAKKSTAETETRETRDRKGPAKKQAAAKAKEEGEENNAVVPLILKADTAGSLEALEQEVKMRIPPKVTVKIIHKGVGGIGEGDLKVALCAQKPIIVGFNVQLDASAKGIAERHTLQLATFDVIYKLTEWLEEALRSRAPKELVMETSGGARVLKIFSAEKDRQILGGKVLQGALALGDEFRILRREVEIGKGKIRELQKFKEKISIVQKDAEFGALVSSATAVMPGDRIESFRVVEK
ncbi:MAG: bacterial translation initiation factor 2 (bIF-2) [Parcubacteria group bacterium Greene0416_79]|nr:MAG: bacterial translation initiation factor 2 (bIF-2) [Parcubacteria group bacterium Greene0416_79]